MSSTSSKFANRDEHRAWIASQSLLPKGFRIGTTTFSFVPVEAPKPGRMSLTLIALDRPTDGFAARYTRNAFPGAPVIVGRGRVAAGSRVGAVVVNNKISNVCAPGGVEAAEKICEGVAAHLGFLPREVIPSSTGVIGWRLPVPAMLDAAPAAVAALQADTILPAADAIMTTDLYAKVRRASVGEGSVVGIAKGAGMIEPNLATMLVFLLTDVELPRAELDAALGEAVEASFQGISIDTDTSTSDSVLLVSSGASGPADPRRFREALTRVCRDLAEDIVRNGEGVHHVIRVVVRGAPDLRVARGVGKSVVSSPLFQCAVNGNDPNVGRLVCAIGKHLGGQESPVSTADVRISMGGIPIFGDGVFRLDHEIEAALVKHLRSAELYASVPPVDGVNFRPPVSFPPHERCVEIDIDLGQGSASCEVLGADRSHEYISENADYRS